ncbi:MAG: type II secretion system protein [Nibricoccus sp.]
MNKRNSKRGSILVSVLCTTAIVLIIVASIASVIGGQRKLSLKKELMFQATNVAETALDYVYSCVINDISTNSVNGAKSIPTTGYKTFPLDSSVSSFLTGSVINSAETAYNPGTISYSDLEVRVLPATAATRVYIDGNDPANSDSTIKNMWTYQRTVPLIAKVTARIGGNSYTAYVQKTIASQEVALFQYSVFFQGQLHMHRGFRPMGPVHTNGMLFLNAHDDDYATYNGAVSATGHIYRGSTFDQGGTGSDGYGYVPINSDGDADFTDSTVQPSAKGITSPHLKIYVKTDGSGNAIYAQYINKDVHTDAAGWKKWATDTFEGNLQDKSHEVPEVKLFGSSSYRQDVKSTNSNEFCNGPYKLLEPTFPSSTTYDGVRMSNNSNNLQANASLILRIEYNKTDTIYLHKLSDGTPVTIQSGTINGLGTYPDLTQYSDPWLMFVVKGYKVKKTWDPQDTTKKFIHDYTTSITLPDKVVGAAASDAQSIQTNFKMEPFEVQLTGDVSVTSSLPADSTTASPIMNLGSTAKTKLNNTGTTNGTIVKVVKGLFDSRMGRGVVPLTIDIDMLKDAMEAPTGNLPPTSDPVPGVYTRNFRDDFPVTADDATYIAWKNNHQLIYIEFPTSLEVDTGGTVNTKNGISTLPFKYESSPETLHPDRSTDTDSRSNRTDKIVPIAAALRRYPASNANLNSTILDPRYAIPAVQLINGRYLPHANSADSTEGFSIATNVPVYIVGNYNADGDFTTGSNITSDAPTAFANADTGEIPAAIFCDTFTVLSNGWGLAGSSGRSNRQNSFYGRNNGSTKGGNTTVGSIGVPPGRPAVSSPERWITNHLCQPASPGYKYLASNPASGSSARPYVEIGACIATSEYPIFEFFTHALENYADMYNVMSTTKANPIIFKGSMVGMYHSEIQHIKQAYGRDVASDVQTSGDPSGDVWQQHGASAIAGTRYHKFYAVDGTFPPGTPKAYLTAQKDYALLRWADPTKRVFWGADPSVSGNYKTDSEILTAAGFTP